MRSVSVIVPWDRAYRRARQVRRGRKRPPPGYDAFFADVERRFGVRPLWLEADHLDHPGRSDVRPRLEVVLERTAEHQQFLKAPLTFDGARRRAVAEMFVQHITARTLASMFGLPRRRVDQPDLPQQILVTFSDFERVALEDARASLTTREEDDFEAGLELGDELWCVKRSGWWPVVFVHTDAQARAVEAADLLARWADAYFALVTEHDEFAYLTREQVSVAVDSKERFDNDFAGNWYHYIK